MRVFLLPSYVLPAAYSLSTTPLQPVGMYVVSYMFLRAAKGPGSGPHLPKYWSGTYPVEHLKDLEEVPHPKKHFHNNDKYYQKINKHTSFFKRACSIIKKCSLSGRKWGLGLPMHMKLASIILNMSMYIDNIDYYIVLVSINSLLAIPYSR